MTLATEEEEEEEEEATAGIAADTGLFARLGRRVAQLRGWRRVLAALGSGVIAAGAMPPLDFVPLLFVSFPLLLWLAEGRPRAHRPFRGRLFWNRAFWDGWWWGFGFFTPTLYWTAVSMFVDIGQFWWMVPFALFGLPAYLALYPGLAVMATRILVGERRSVFGRALVFAGLWTFAEYLRGHAFTGFPWSSIGYAWSGTAAPLLAMLQSAAVFGVLGLGFVTTLAAGLAAGVAAGSPWRALVPAALLLAMPMLGGALRLSAHPAAATGIALRIVQPGAAESGSFSPEEAAADFRRLLALAARPGADRIAVQVWPEGAVPTFLNRDASARRAIGAILPPGGLVLTGTLRDDPEGRAFNSVMAVDAAGNPRGAYDKAHLVPFGEYVPFHRYLPFVDAIAGNRFDFSTGPGPRSLDLPGHLPRVGPVICYEAIFPHAVVDEALRPDWIVNVTDDGWFGRSTGPAQHFAISRVRAVEEGLPLVRAANTGISGIVDSLGRIGPTLALGEIGTLDVVLPSPLPETLYGRFGDLLPMLMALASTIFGFIALKSWQINRCGR